jgi:transposase-like protein
MKYSEERREAILRKLLPPDSRSVAEVAAEEGISVPTLYAWRKQARGKGRLLPDHGPLLSGLLEPYLCLNSSTTEGLRRGSDEVLRGASRSDSAQVAAA